MALAPFEQGKVRLAMWKQVFNMQFNRFVNHANGVVYGLTITVDAQTRTLYPVGNLFIGIASMADDFAHLPYLIHYEHYAMNLLVIPPPAPHTR